VTVGAWAPEPAPIPRSRIQEESHASADRGLIGSKAVEHGFLLIADITGYTRYLSRSELDHAQGTLTDLLELLIEHTRPPLVISRLEGDAVFSYAVDEGSVTGQTFLEAIEDTYVAFRRAIELMVLNNTCRCNACANVSSLDLKFFVHHGSFMFQDVGGHKELVGTDVNLIHRLLKNSVTATTGFGAYVLCTEAAEEALGLGGPSETMVRHVENVDDFGDVVVWVKDMHPVFEARKADEIITYLPEEVMTTIATETALPPEIVWDYLNQSDARDLLMGADRHEVRERTEGRVGPGTTYLCFHGKQVMPQVVLEWRPFERVVFLQRAPMLGRPIEFLIDLRLTPVDGATRLEMILARPTAALPRRLLFRTMVRRMQEESVREMEAFRSHIEEDFERRRRVETVPISTEQVAAAVVASLQSGP
jgi:uncharacterized protein YndB with AHSA1/START domain